MVRGARARNGARTSRRPRSRGEDRLAVCALERETPDAARRETPDASRRGGGVPSTHARERSCPPADILAVSNTPATCGLTRTRCSTRDEHARFSRSAGCASPTPPLAHSVCPTKDWPPTSVSGAPTSRPSAASDAPNSMGSPRLVPVPCICNVFTSLGRMDPASSAARITARCAKPLGAVKPLDRPSWFTAVDASDTRPGGI